MARLDDLTGLGDRRQLLDALDERVRQPAVSSLVLGVFDLDGFRAYNDTFGHPAGDALLARLGRRLTQLVAGRGSAYRMDGDEFAVLVEGEAEAGLGAVAEAAAALGESGDGFRIGCSYGTVTIPTEAADPAEALRLAGRRLSHQKASRPGSAMRQAVDILTRAAHESRPVLTDHLTSVGVRAEATARRLGLPDEEVERVRLAGRLHDIGKMAVPESILHKPGPLDDQEWAVIKNHPIVGERIISAAPALEPVARLVRSTHERVDGTGYPDGLEGDEIPLGARIVAACDAFDAMVSNRAYGAAMSAQSAVSELLRGSGTQFDPGVVEVFCALVGVPADAAVTGDASAPVE